MKLGISPSDRYYQSWLTQRIANYAPEEVYARNSPASILKQIANLPAQELQTIHQSLLEEIDNLFLSTANPVLLDSLYKIDIGKGLDFNTITKISDEDTYVPPKVYATIDGIEHEISQAYNNDIESLYYKAIPSRVVDENEETSYFPVLEPSSPLSLPNINTDALEIEGPLYITLEGNTIWEYRTPTNIYYSKLVIKGVTRKGTTVTESLPLRYNGTFKTVNHWKKINEIYANYISESSLVTIGSLPWHAIDILDYRNLNVDANGEEKYRFLSVSEERAFGSTLIVSSYTTNDFSLIRKGIEEKDIVEEIELLNENNQNISNVSSYTLIPNSDLLICNVENYLYIYDIKLPYPNISYNLQDTDAKVAIVHDKWIVARGESIFFKTRNLDFKDLPFEYRWVLISPAGVSYTISNDGSLNPTSDNDWTQNGSFDTGNLIEQQVNILFDENGTYDVLFEAKYLSQREAVRTLTSKTIVFVPAITPEIVIPLPSGLTGLENMAFNDDGSLYVETNYSLVKKLRLCYDYFLVDYLNKAIWLKEYYSSVRVEIV